MTALVVGVDLSLRSTGVATAKGCLRIQPAKGLAGVARLRVIRAAVAEHTAGADLVVVEGPSYGSNGGLAHERGGLWWLVVERLDALGRRVAVAAPSVRAKYATGKGNAGKDEVLAAAVRRFPSLAFTGNDEADALWLCALGHEALGSPIVALPAVQRAAAGKLTWVTEKPEAAV